MSLLALFLFMAGAFAYSTVHPQNADECRSFCAQQYLSSLVSGMYAPGINYSCSFATGSCQFSLIPLPSGAAPSRPPSSSQLGGNSAPSAPGAAGSANPLSTSLSPNTSASIIPISNLSTPPFASAPPHAFDEPCAYSGTHISNISQDRAIVSFEFYDAQSGRPLDSMLVGLAQEGENLTSDYAPQTEFALRPGTAYYALIGDNSSRYYVTYRNFSVGPGTQLTIRICPRLLSNPPAPPAVGQHDFLLLEINKFLLPSPQNSSLLSRQSAVHVSSSIAGAFTFQEGRAREFYILPSGQYDAPLNNRTLPVPASGFPHYSNGRVSGFFIGYLNRTAWAPSQFIDSGRLSIPDSLDGEPLGRIMADTDYSRFYCRDCSNTSNRSLQWVQLFGHASPVPGLLSNDISPGFSTPSGLLYNYYSPTRLEFLVPLYPAQPEPPPRPSINIGGRPVRGAPNATLTIVEFGDYLCPFTKQAEPLMQKALADYAGQINEVYLPYIVNPPSKQADSAAECAADQGQFWEYRDAIFSDSKVDDASLKAKAQALGLDMGAFRQCFATQEKYASLDAMQAEGNSSGVYATPTFFINGRMLVGTRPYEDFKQVIKEELANANAASSGG